MDRFEKGLKELKRMLNIRKRRVREKARLVGSQTMKARKMGLEGERVLMRTVRRRRELKGRREGTMCLT